jgi:hypothetical protein
MNKPFEYETGQFNYPSNLKPCSELGDLLYNLFVHSDSYYNDNVNISLLALFCGAFPDIFNNLKDSLKKKSIGAFEIFKNKTENPV